jgi:hypothetical protein
MQGSWNHGRPYYRCKFPANYAISEDKHPKTIYVREDDITPAIDTWLSQLFDDDHLDTTSQALATASGPDPTHQARLTQARRTITECDNKLTRYREALEAGTDPAIVNGWIQEVQLARKAAETTLRTTTGQPGLTSNEIKTLVRQLKGIVSILANAHPDDRKAVYDKLNLTIVYHDNGRMQVTAGPDACTNECVGGGTLPGFPWVATHDSPRFPWSPCTGEGTTSGTCSLIWYLLRNRGDVLGHSSWYTWPARRWNRDRVRVPVRYSPRASLDGAGVWMQTKARTSRDRRASGPTQA